MSELTREQIAAIFHQVWLHADEQGEQETRVMAYIAALRAKIEALEKENVLHRAIPYDQDGTPFAAASAWRTECSRVHAELAAITEAVGLATTCVPSMEMDVSHPVEMMQQVCAAFTNIQQQLAAMTQERDEAVSIGRANAEKFATAEAAMTWERDEAERREKEWEVDYSADLKQIIAERDRLKEALSEARQLAESARWGERGERG